MLGARTELAVAPGPADMSFSTGRVDTGPPGPPPAWDPPPESINAHTLRGVPPVTIQPITDQHRIPTLLPETEVRPGSARSDLGAIEVVGRAQPPTSAIVTSPHPVVPVPPAPPPPPPSEPAPANFQARPADEFMKAFLGPADPGSEASEDDGFGASMSAPRPPPPWPMLGALVAVVALVGVYVMRDQLFGQAVADPAPLDAKAEPKPEEPKPAPPAPTPAPPEVKAEPDTKAVPPAPPAPPAPTDPAFLERLSKARAAYGDGKLKAAAAALTDLSQQAPNHPEVLLLTAQVQLEEGKIPESQLTANKCVEVDPKLADCWLTLGVLRQNSKDEAGAVVAYETYLKLAPAGRYARDANSQLARLKKASG